MPLVYFPAFPQPRKKKIQISGLFLQQALLIKGRRVVPITVSKNVPLKFFHDRKAAFFQKTFLHVKLLTFLISELALKKKKNQKNRKLVLQQQTVIFILEYCHHTLGYTKAVYVSVHSYEPDSVGNYGTTMKSLQNRHHIATSVSQSKPGHLAIKKHKADELTRGEDVSFPEK